MKRLLFVDDEPKVLDGLQRMLYPFRSQWQMVFASSGREALQRLNESEYDVVFADVRMPEMGGVELLSEVTRRCPQTIRIVLSGTTDLELKLGAVDVAHQYLYKPCDVETLRAAVERAFSGTERLPDAALRRLISGIQTLPSAPAVTLKLADVLGSGNASEKHIAAVIAQDMAMTAKVLQLVNSAFFGSHRQITNPAEAVAHLGIGTVTALALSVIVFSQLPPARSSRIAEDLTHHGLRVGALARKIAESSGFAGTAAGDCFVAGLLHDIGKLVLATSCAKQFTDALLKAHENSSTASAAELAEFGVTHSEVGAYLLWLWGLPDCLTEVVASHHKPHGQLPEAGLLIAVHVADALVNGRAESGIDFDCLSKAGLLEQLPRWRELHEDLPAPSRISL